MATRFSNALVPNNSTDAAFRAWVQFIEDTFVTTGGWVVTSDTGQMTISTALHPTGNFVVVGYRIYRMNDSLQVTKPVFLRIDYGAGPSNIPGFLITLGSGTDGAGNITGKWYGSKFVSTSSGDFICGNSANTPTCNSYGSAASNRCSFGLFCSVANCTLCFSIERTKATNGADTGDGLLLTFSMYQNAGLNRSLYLIYGSTAQPGLEYGVNYILTSQNPTQSFGGDIGVGVIHHFKGYAQQPGIGVIVVNNADFANESNFTVQMYGSNHVYQHLGSALPPEKSLICQPQNAAFNKTTDSNARVAILYE